MSNPAFCHELDPDCNQCGKPIYWKCWIFFQNKVWHEDCFKCIKCFVNFDQSQKQDILLPILTEDGHLRCKSCFDEFECKKIESRKKENDGKIITIDWAKVNQNIDKEVKEEIKKTFEKDSKDNIIERSDEKRQLINEMVKEKEENIFENKLFKRKQKDRKKEEQNGKNYQKGQFKKEYQSEIIKDQRVEKLMNKARSSKEEGVSEREYLDAHYDECKAKLYREEQESESRWRNYEHKKHCKKKIYQEQAKLDNVCNCSGCRNYIKTTKIRYYCKSKA